MNGCLKDETVEWDQGASGTSGLNMCTLLWCSGPAMLISSILGGVLALRIGCIKALLAIFLGNIFLYFYSVLLNISSMQHGSGLTFQASATFGRSGKKFFSAMVSFVMLSWLVLQLGFLLQFFFIISANYHFPVIACFVLFLFLFFLLGHVNFPLVCATSIILFLLGLIYILRSIAFLDLWSTIRDFNSYGLYPDQSLGLSISMVISFWIAGATASADLGRWFVSKKQACLSVLFSFPFVSLVAMVAGVIVVPYLLDGSGHYRSAHDLLDVLIHKNSSQVFYFLGLFFTSSMFAICIHTLTNAVSDFCSLIEFRSILVWLFLSICIAIMAKYGLYRYVISWSHIIGILISPIGGVIIADQFIMNSHYASDIACRRISCLSWLFGVVIAFISFYYEPGLVDCLVGVIFSIVFYCTYELYSQRLGHHHDY